MCRTVAGAVFKRGKNGERLVYKLRRENEMAKTRSLPDKYYDKDYEHNGIDILVQHIASFLRLHGPAWKRILGKCGFFQKFF